MFLLPPFCGYITVSVKVFYSHCSHCSHARIENGYESDATGFEMYFSVLQNYINFSESL